jgi:hypothetical protein
MENMMRMLCVIKERREGRHNANQLWSPNRRVWNTSSFAGVSWS